MTSKDCKRIDIVKNIIIDYFYENDLKSSCLSQSYILYKYIQSLNMQPKLIKGYIIDKNNKIYWGHFWVEISDKVYDIATETYLKYQNNIHSKINRELSIATPISKEYKCIDKLGFDIIKNNAYIRCINGEFFNDMKENTDYSTYLKIKKLYNKLLSNT